MLNFCTLFDSTYLSRGLAMYNSLTNHCPHFRLFVFAFDDNCYNLLKSMNLPSMEVISLTDFEDKKLLEIKPTRTKGEYCWTSTPSTVLYVLDRFKVDHCTYLDSDLYFFSSPQPLLDEMGDCSVLITPHRYTPLYDQSVKTGIYCVQFVTFKNNDQGRTVLDWWRNACIDWCYNRFEDGKFGDQRYLDDWPVRFEGVHVLQHLGGGVAPWNMQQYEFKKLEDGNIIGTELKTKRQFPVIFFHFHSLVFVSPHCFSPRPYYKRNDSSIRLLFRPYIKELEKIRTVFPEINAKEHYLKGFKYIKYIGEVFLRQGFREFHFMKLLHQK